MSVKLLIDANLSWRLCGLLKGDFEEVIHVSRTVLQDPPSDILIWDYAAEHGFSIITNDEDFYLLTLIKGFPPKIVLLKTGNQSTKFIASLISKHKKEIIAFINNAEYSVLEIY